MASVILKIEDDGETGVKCTLDFHPPIDDPQEKVRAPSHVAAVQFLDWLKDQAAQAGDVLH